MRTPCRHPMPRRLAAILSLFGPVFFGTTAIAAAQDVKIGLSYDPVPLAGGQLEPILILYPDPFADPLGVFVYQVGEPPCSDPLDCLGENTFVFPIGSSDRVIYPALPEFAGFEMSFFVLAIDGEGTLGVSDFGNVELRDAHRAGAFLSRFAWLRAKDRIAMQTEPFYANFRTLKSRADAALSTPVDPFHMDDIRQIRFGWCSDPTPGVDDTLRELVFKLERQSDAIRSLALVFALTGERSYGDHAVERLKAWAAQGTLVNMYDFHIDFANTTFDGMTDDGYCGVRPWNFALDAMWQTYGLINVSDAYSLLSKNGYSLSVEDDRVLQGWILELAEAVNSSFHAWTRWADTHTGSGSYERYRSDNHLTACLAGLLAAASALDDDALADYVINGGSWTDRMAGPYANPSHFKDIVDRVIESGTGPENEGRLYEEKILRDPPIGYALFHLWFLWLVTLQAEVHYGEDLWSYTGSDGGGLELAFERYADFVLGRRESPRPDQEGDLHWYRWNWEAAVARWPSKPGFREVIDSGSRDQFIIQSLGPVPLLIGEN